MPPQNNPLTENRKLSDGNSIPVLGLGVWQVPNGPSCVQAVLTALEVGYRHIDTAQAYENEESVGEAVRQSGLSRQDVFITTKFFPGSRDPAAELGKSLKRLGMDYVDLYLVHWPQGGPTRAWAGMQQAHRSGQARSIGVSNFDAQELDAVMSIAEVLPVVNQVELNPFAYRRALVERSREHNVEVEAYSPLGTGRHLQDPAVAQVAGRLGRSPAQVLVRWAVQHDFIVLPKSVHADRIAENARVFDFSLSQEDMASLDGLDRTRGTGLATDHKWW